MAFKKIDAPSIKELFLTQIEELILSGELKPGDRLPSERDLADTMEISKTIVHEGIRDLARRGFLNVESRKGVYVADYTTTGNMDTLFAIIRYRGDMPDTKMLISLLDTRIYLECPALTIVAKKHTAEDIAKLEALLADVHTAISSDAVTFANALFLYRRTIVSLSGNCISPLIMNAFFTSSISAWAYYVEYTGQQTIYDTLEQTTEYIKAGDSESAIRLFQECIERYKRHLSEGTRNLS